MIRVAVVERNILGVLGYRAECLDCAWAARPRTTEEAAVKDAKGHRHPMSRP